MKQTRKPLLLLALLLVGALLFSSVPALAGSNHGDGRSLEGARQALEQQLMSMPGFVGIAHSEEDGEIVVFLENVQAKALASSRYEGFSVRTEVTGVFRAGAVQLAEPAESLRADDISPTRTGVVRPLMGGTSVSAYVPGQSWAGTLGMVTYDNRILSNAHVIAMDLANNFLAPGTPVIQPARGHGGVPANRVGELEGYIPIDFSDGAVNYADAAIATIDSGVDGLSGWQFGAGTDYQVSGTTTVAVGDTVRKSGRTTGVTTGAVAHTNAAGWVDYDGQVAYFDDQILVNGSFSQQGDSGSVVDKGGAFVGLVFAGNDDYSLVCKAGYIIDGLGIAVEPTQVHHPQMTVSPTSFDVTLPPDTVWTDTLTIGNTGDAPLTYDITDGDYPWLDVNPKSGSVPAGGAHVLTISMDTSGLDPGDYSAGIVIASNDPDGNSTTVPVTLHVSDVMPTVTTQAASDVGTDSASLRMFYDFGTFGSGLLAFWYRVQGAADWQTFTGWESESGSGTYVKPVAELSSGTTYEFLARLAYYDAGWHHLSGWPSHTLTTGEAVTPPPTPTNPRPGSTGSPGPVLPGKTVTFAWDASPGATRYALGARNRDTGLLEVETWVYDTSHTVTLEPDTRYQWNVAAWSNAGYSAFTTLRYFQTPADEAPLDPVEWNCPLGGVSLSSPNPGAGRPYLTTAVACEDIEVSEGAQLWGIYYLVEDPADPLFGVWLYYVPGFVDSTLTDLTPGHYYRVTVSAACVLTLPQA